MIGQLWRFAGVGLIVTLTHVLVALLAQSAFGLTPQAANLSGFCFATFLSYVGHSFVTFGATENHGLQVPRFVLVALAGLASSSAMTFVVVSQLQGSFVQAMVTVAIVVPPITFLVSKFWVFHGQERAGWKWHGFLTSLGISLVFLAVYWGRIINHDVAWYLTATQKWLFEDAKLYVDLVEVNPPLNFYLTAPAVLLSNTLSISATNAQYLVVAILMTISFTWVGALLKRDQRLPLARRLLVLGFIGLATVLVAIDNIAQREHLMLLFILPYVFGYLTLPTPDKGKGAYVRAGFAAIGLCLKPHFMLYPIMLTLLMIWRRKSLWPIISGVNLLIIAVGATYLGLVMLLHPEHLNEIVPTALHVYGAFGFGLTAVIAALRPFSILLFALIGYLVLTNPGIAKGFGAFVAVLIAAIISYLAQWTGFPYHAIPIQTFIMIASIWVLAQPDRTARLTILSVIAFTSIAAIQLTYGPYKSGLYTYLKENIGPQQSGYGLMVFATGLEPGFPLALETDANWISRYPSMWLIPGAINAISNACTNDTEKCAKLREILNQTRYDIVSDFEKAAPDIVVFDNSPQFITDKNFTFEAFLAKDPRYESLISHYEIKPRITEYSADFLIIMQRKSNP